MAIFANRGFWRLNECLRIARRSASVSLDWSNACKDSMESFSTTSGKELACLWKDTLTADFWHTINALCGTVRARGSRGRVVGCHFGSVCSLCGNPAPSEFDGNDSRSSSYVHEANIPFPSDERVPSSSSLELLLVLSQSLINVVYWARVLVPWFGYYRCCCSGPCLCFGLIIQ